MLRQCNNIDRVRLASQSMRHLTILGPVASEPMKIKLLGTPANQPLQLLFGIPEFTGSPTLVAISGIVSLPLFAAHGAAYHWIPVILALACAVFAITRRSPILAGVVRAFGRRAPFWLARAEKCETSIRTYRLEQPALVNRMFWIGLACQLLVASEVVVVLWSLHLPIHFFAVMAIEGVTRALKLASGWVPARVGFDEGGAIFGVCGGRAFTHAWSWVGFDLPGARSPVGLDGDSLACLEHPQVRSSARNHTWAFQQCFRTRCLNASSHSYSGIHCSDLQTENDRTTDASSRRSFSAEENCSYRKPR
jgi:hypothetical protein